MIAMTVPAWPSTRFKLDIGDRMPNIFGPDQHGGRFSIMAAPAGAYAILSVPAGESAAADAALKAFDETVRADTISPPNAVIAMTGTADRVHDRAKSLDIRTSTLADTRGQLAALFRAGRDGQADESRARDSIIAIVTDPDQTIRSVLSMTDIDSFKRALARALDEVERVGERTHAHGFAPVLRVPHLLSRAQCRALIATWETSHQPGMVGGTGRYGEAANRTAAHRVCYDHFVRDDKDLYAQIVSTIGPRIRDAVERAYQFDIQCYDPFLIVGYPASEGGFFGSHRDNTNPALMHRRFALSINLNTGEYEGGGVWFPEYADTLYDPPVGDGVVFSCSLLHEAKVVTKGWRFILSGFMWGAAEDESRQRNAREAAARRQRSTPIAG